MSNVMSDHRGAMTRSAASAGILAIFTGTVRARLITLVATLLVGMLVIGAAGIVAMRGSNTAMRTMYEERTVALGQLLEIDDRLRDNIATLLEGAHLGLAGKDVSVARPRVEANIKAINDIWAAYMAVQSSADERAAAARFAEARKAMLAKVFAPTLELLAGGKYAAAADLLVATGKPLLADTKAQLDKLTDIHTSGARNLYEEAQQRYLVVLGVVGVLLIAGMAIGAVLSRSAIRAVTRPLDRLNQLMEKIGRGIFDSPVEIEHDDELGHLARGVQAMQAKLAADRDAAAESDRRSAAQRRADMHRLADEFEAAVGDIVDTVSSAAAQLESSAGMLNETADRSQRLAKVVAASSEEASTNVQSVASASEELSSSVNEISRQVQESARMSSEAVDQARATNDRVSELSQAAARIGDVVELISSIAGQTNLLALNATIEAARAGDAGRGFAVVATEVKALAEQTAKATGEISQQISGIQSATQDSVGAIRAIAGTIERLSEISSTIAAAVEEQGAATQEISRNVQQAAQGTHEVSANVANVQADAAKTGGASSEVLAAARSLSSDSGRLKQEVGRFLNSVRAA